MTIRTDGGVEAAPVTVTEDSPAAFDGCDTCSQLVGAMSRRTMFAMGAGGVLGAAALAACGSSSAGSGGTSAAAATTGSSSSSGTSLAKLADIPVGGSLAVEVGGKPIIISQPTEGKVVAFSAVCPHQGCTVGVAKPLKCPCHGSAFNPATGALIKGPATRGLTAVNVSVSGEKVVQG
jgi:Rieske Fe-S protein